MSIELVAEALSVLGPRFTSVMEASETSVAAVSVSVFRGEDGMWKDQGLAYLAEEGRW